MEISRDNLAIVRAVAADASALAEALVAGQRLNGRVVQLLVGNAALLAFGDRRLVAETRVPLSPGQLISVEVMKGGPAIELRLEPSVLPSTPAGDHAYALAALLTALSRPRTEAPVDLGAFLRALAQMPSADGRGQPHPLATALAQALRPLFPSEGRDAVEAALRRWWRDGGLLFEAHVRQAVAAGTGSTPEQALATVRSDLKVLLGQIAEAVAAGRLPDGAESVAAEQQTALAARLLGQQVEFAYQWVAHGVVTFEVPVGMPETVAGLPGATLTVPEEPSSQV